MNTVSPTRCLFQWVADRSLSCQRRKGGTQPWLIRHGWPHRHSDGRGWGGVRVHECEPVWACMHACVRDVFAIYDHNILPRLKMIIINIFILYFIQIRHTDDFPSTGTRLVIHNLPSHSASYMFASAKSKHIHAFIYILVYYVIFKSPKPSFCELLL